MKMKTFNNDKGFTLLELLIVVSLLGILATIAIPLFLGQRTKAVQSEARSNLSALRLLQERVFADTGCYAPRAPGTETDLEDKTVAQLTAIGLQRFQPGTPANLNYHYDVRTTGADPLCADAFTATARPKTGTIVDGTANFWINSRNENNF